MLGCLRAHVITSPGERSRRVNVTQSSCGEEPRGGKRALCGGRKAKKHGKSMGLSCPQRKHKAHPKHGAPKQRCSENCSLNTLWKCITMAAGGSPRPRGYVCPWDASGL